MIEATLTFTALVREPGPSFARALSEHPEKNTIDPRRALTQHRAYVEALKYAGGTVVYLEPLKEFPDSPFVEDTAVILNHRAVLCPMKEPTRAGETASVLKVLENYRSVETLPTPATLDGGDVLITPRAMFAGLSRRTNGKAVSTLAERTELPVVPVPVLRGLHLKSAVSILKEDLLVIDPASVAPSAFQGFRMIEVEDTERYAANCLTLGGRVLIPAGCPRLKGEIEKEGLEVVELDISEFQKADGGVTCLSLIIPAGPA